MLSIFEMQIVLDTARASDHVMVRSCIRCQDEADDMIREHFDRENDGDPQELNFD